MNRVVITKAQEQPLLPSLLPWGNSTASNTKHKITSHYTCRIQGLSFNCPLIFHNWRKCKPRSSLLTTDQSAAYFFPFQQQLKTGGKFLEKIILRYIGYFCNHWMGHSNLKTQFQDTVTHISPSSYLEIPVLPLAWGCLLIGGEDTQHPAES